MRRLTRVAAALAFERGRPSAGNLKLVGIDQPPIVPSATGARPADRVPRRRSAGAAAPCNRRAAAATMRGVPPA